MKYKYVGWVLLWLWGSVYHVISEEINVVAYVNNTVLTQNDLNKALKQGRWGQVNRELEKKLQGNELIIRRKNLRRKVLEDMVTDRLINDEAKVLIPVIPKSMIDDEITNRVKYFSLETKEQLRQYLKLQRITWKKFIEELEESIRIGQYKRMKVRAHIRVSPKQIHTFYEQHKNDEKVQTRISEIGEEIAIVLRVQEMVSVRHLYIMPILDGKKMKPEELEALIIEARNLSNSFESVKNKSNEEIDRWLSEAAKEHDKLMVVSTVSDIERHGYLPDELQTFAFDENNKGKWSFAVKTKVPTNNRNYSSERWDRLCVIELKKSYIKPFEQVQRDIERYLEDASFAREMKILREQLWKKGGVKIMLPESK